MARRLEAAGVGAIVLPSLFEEEILAEELELNRSLEQGTEHFAEALDYFPAVEAFVGAADRYLARLVAGQGQSRSRHRQPECDHQWRLGPPCAAHRGRGRRCARTEPVPRRGRPAQRRPRPSKPPISRSIAAVRATVAIPLAVKLSPYLLAFANFAAAVTAAGADGLVLFNRFYQPDIDLEALEVVPRSLSQPELRLPVRWIAICDRSSAPGSRWRPLRARNPGRTWSRA